MTPLLPPLPNRAKFSLDEFERLTNMGAFNGRKIELIEGELIEKMSQNQPHWSAVVLMQYKLLSLFGQGFLVLVQMPMRADESKPEPDLAVIEGVPQGAVPIPSTALLVVEVSDTTLDYDRDTKAHLYARAGVPDYWIVDLNARQIEVRRDPRPDASQPLGWTYGTLQTLAVGDELAPLHRPDARFSVADVMP